MLAMTSIVSGSLGNVTLIHTTNEAILIDCGLSFKRLQEKIEFIGYDISKIKAIFITHEHNDHISGLKTVSNALAVPAYFNIETSLVLKHKKKYPDRAKIFTNGSPIALGGFTIFPFSIPHDGVNTVAYTIYYEEKKIAIATDFGSPIQSVVKNLENCDALLLESNHSVDMLLNCEKRPWKIKQRILSKHGHLSNDSCQEILKKVMSSKLKNLILGHISDDTNDCSLVEDLTLQTFQNLGYEKTCLQVLPQKTISKTIVV